MVAVAVAGLVALPPSPACACSCKSLTEQEAFDAAGAVFVGTVTDVDIPGIGPIIGSADRVNVSFVVSKVYKADVPADVVVRTVRDGASCGYPFAVGSRYVVFATADDGVWRTGLCSGTQLLPPAVEPTGFADGYSPGPAAGNLDRRPPWPIVAGVAGLLVATAAAVLVWVRRRRAGSAPGADE